jgi:hypothetical protein
MTFSAYIQRQKSLIRERHEGEMFFICKDACIPVRSTEEIMREMENLEGLNKNERQSFTIKRRCSLR